MSEDLAIRDVFETVLDKLKVRIFPDRNNPQIFIDRDLRRVPYSHGLEMHGFNPLLGWHSAVIRCDDIDKPELIDSQDDIHTGMYYAPHNVDAASNHWDPNDPIMVLDLTMCGSYVKELRWKGAILCTYRPGGAAFFWIHINLKTDEAKVV